MQIVVEMVVQTNGASVRCLYGEELNLQRLAILAIARGSHVDPTADGQWAADMSPVTGPRPGPYHRHSDALIAEHLWLEQHWLLMAR